METKTVANQAINIHRYNTVIVGAGAAGMNCAVHLYEFMSQKGVPGPQERIAVVTGGIGLGASRMSGSDKQTYYKMGTSPDVPDSAEEFAKSLTAAGCAHGDLALAEAVGSLREFYHLVRAGVPFPHDPAGSYVGYKTDHDPYERATSAGPRTSRFMSECLQRQVQGYGIRIFDQQEAAELLTISDGGAKRIAGVVTIDKKELSKTNYALNVYLCENLILAAGGPGELYKTTVYPKGQLGIHGLAFKAGLVGENLTASQFGLASTKFRWNVSGTYMQAIPRMFSTGAGGGDEKDFLADYFPTMSRLATGIFLKGYQWPFNPQKIENFQSSLIDVLVFNEIQKHRRVFMDFRSNPVGSASMEVFSLDDIEAEALDYLRAAGALQATPIERLAHMNPPAVEIYKENGIDLRAEPLEIALCAQHNNGGFAVNKWWESNIPHTFVIGEMAGTHGVNRPGGSALNAGQVGGLRAAEYIANVYTCEPPDTAMWSEVVEQQLLAFVNRVDGFAASAASLGPEEAISQIQERMTASGGHVRETGDAKTALAEAVELCKDIRSRGLAPKTPHDLIAVIRAEHLALTSVAYLKAIVALLEAGGGARGSYLVLSDDGVEIHPDIVDKDGRPLRFKPENEALRDSILQVQYAPQTKDLFVCDSIPTRPVPKYQKAFELAWRDFREGEVFRS